MAKLRLSGKYEKRDKFPNSFSLFKTSSCYIQFSNVDEADRALVENGRMFHNTPIQVAPKTMSPENVRLFSFDPIFWPFLGEKTTTEWGSFEATWLEDNSMQTISGEWQWTLLCDQTRKKIEIFGNFRQYLHLEASGKYENKCIHASDQAFAISWKVTIK